MDLELLNINLQPIQNHDLPIPEEIINYATGNDGIVYTENENQNIENEKEPIHSHLPKDIDSKDVAIEQKDCNKSVGLCNFKGFEIVPNNNNDKIVIKLTNSEKKTSNLDDNVNRKKKKTVKSQNTEFLHSEKVNENGLMGVEIVLVNCNPSSYCLDEYTDVEETERTITKRISGKKRKETLKLQETKKEELKQEHLQFLTLIKSDRNSLKKRRKKTQQKNDETRLKDRLKKREKRQNAAYKERERERDKIRQRLKRADLDYRIQERMKDRERKRTQSSLKKLKALLESATKNTVSVP